MADWITYKLTGTEALSARFKTLSQEMQRKIVVPAAKDAMDIVLKDAIQRASAIDDPRTVPDISKNIALIEDTKYFAETGSTKVSVGVRKTKRGQRGGNTYYWWWITLGNSRMRAQPFMQNALSQNREAVFREFISSARFELLKIGD
jgi:HK97 gp10 family phage protein